MKMRLSKFIIIIILLSGGFPLCLAQREGHDDFDKVLEENSFKEASEAISLVDDLEHMLYDPINDASVTNISPLKAPLPPADSKIIPYSQNKEQRWWFNRWKNHNLVMSDTTVIWPKFLKFCVDIYNWGDRFFNTYDPAYVEGTGKRWKVRLVNDNWLDTYAMTLPHGLSTTMNSNVYSNIGAYLQYMAVSVGSSFDIEKIFRKTEPRHNKLEFGFNCSLFNAELYYHENRGGVYIRKFGDINDGKIIREYFPGVNMSTLGFDIYYFFNHKKYSQGAAYNFSKYQLKSQGSFMVGFTMTNQKLSFDFSQLPDQLKDYLPDADISKYYFHYNSVAILGGYGYNWVLAPKLLFNATVMPAIGFSHYYEDSLEGNKYLLSLNIQGRISLTYNLGNYFFGLFGKMNGHYYKQGNISLFSSIENFSVYIGLRF